MAAPLIDVRNLSVGFDGRDGTVRPILRTIDLTVREGETIGIVGESGSGKSTLALAMMGYLKSGLRVLDGEACFRGRDTFALQPKVLEAIRGGDLALIPQNAGQALTPTLRVGAQIEESLRLHGSVDASKRRDRVTELLAQVRLPDPEAIAARFPHELSGGQQQRAAVAMALAGEPNALLLDEPTTGLDVTTQAHVLELLRELTQRSGTAMVYVSHDLGAIARVADRIVVMYAGEIVLAGPARSVLRTPKHPYAAGLIRSIPRLTSPVLPTAMDGRPPQPGGAGAGCAFADRCPLVVARCGSERPALSPVLDGVVVRCHRHDEVASGGLSETMDSPVLASRIVADAAILTLDDVAISYARPGLLDQMLGRRPSGIATVDDISLTIRRGETIGLVGESGSGKSTILKAIAGLVPPLRGRIELVGDGALAPVVEQRSARMLQRIQLIFQNPDESLNPRHTIAEILAQPLRHYFSLGALEIHERSITLLDRVRLGSHYLQRLPSQLSGGEKQRVAIARAFAAEPEVILCDEVTSALDVSVQAAVLALLDRLRREEAVTYLFVSHDLAVVRAFADRVIVLYQGRICEVGAAAQVYAAPSHPYTEMLLGAVLEPDPDSAPKLLGEDVIERAPPAIGCPFQRRCHRRIGAICDTTAPPPQADDSGHVIRCHIPRAELGVMQRAAVDSGEGLRQRTPGALQPSAKD